MVLLDTRTICAFKFRNFKFQCSQAWRCTPLIPVPGGRSRRILEFSASLGCKPSPRTAWTRQRSPVSKPAASLAQSFSNSGISVQNVNKRFCCIVKKEYIHSPCILLLRRQSSMTTFENSVEVPQKVKTRSRQESG